MKRTYRLAFVIPACATMLLSVPALGRDGVAINLPDKRVAVLSEGDLEPASGGSYSIAVFEDRDLVDFLAGAVFSRDGSFFRTTANHGQNLRTSRVMARRISFCPNLQRAQETISKPTRSESRHIRSSYLSGSKRIRTTTSSLP